MKVQSLFCKSVVILFLFIFIFTIPVQSFGVRTNGAETKLEMFKKQIFDMESEGLEVPQVLYDMVQKLEEKKLREGERQLPDSSKDKP